ncbi:hypothetical protein ES703_42489 [subsurface metagenome]
MSILSEAVKGSFLTLIIEGINGWYMAFCPEFDISACGTSEEEVKKDLYDMIKTNSVICIGKKKKGEKVPLHLLKYSERVVQCDNIATLFRRPSAA